MRRRGLRTGSGGLLMLLLAIGLIAAACGSDDDGSTSAGGCGLASVGEGTFPYTFTDSSGTAITLDAAPTQIISYSPGATEILFAIGACDRVVATDEFSDFPAQVAELPKVAYSAPDPERALTFEPDLIIMAIRQEGQVPQFRGAGIPTALIAEADSVQGVLENVRLLGRITGNVEEAGALASEMERRIAAVVEALADVEEGPVVFLELTNDLYTISPDTFIGGMLTLLKARNVAAGAASPFPQLTAEAVIEADPEVVLLTDAEFGESLETVAARPGWSGVRAVINGRVVALDPDIVNRPGPRIVEGIEEMARLLYPDRFG